MIPKSTRKTHLLLRGGEWREGKGIGWEWRGWETRVGEGTGGKSRERK